jgi:hypothetical protein
VHHSLWLFFLTFPLWRESYLSLIYSKQVSLRRSRAIPRRYRDLWSR